jgi:thioredoxin 1
MSQVQSHSSTIAITEENFEQEVKNSPVPVLLDFWASWCVPCKLMKRGVEKAAEALGPDVRVGLVNVDEQVMLVAKYGVRGTPTFVLVKGGDVVLSFSGVSTASGIVSKVRQAIA